jgi:hypothetical protein
MIEKGVKKKYTSKRICSSSDSTGDVLISAKEVKKRHMPKKIYISSSDKTDDDFMSEKGCFFLNIFFTQEIIIGTIAATAAVNFLRGMFFLHIFFTYEIIIGTVTATAVNSL